MVSISESAGVQALPLQLFNSELQRAISEEEGSRSLIKLEPEVDNTSASCKTAANSATSITAHFLHTNASSHRRGRGKSCQSDHDRYLYSDHKLDLKRDFHIKPDLDVDMEVDRPKPYFPTSSITSSSRPGSRSASVSASVSGPISRSASVSARGTGCGSGGGLSTRASSVSSTPSGVLLGHGHGHSHVGPPGPAGSGMLKRHQSASKVVVSGRRCTSSILTPAAKTTNTSSSAGSNCASDNGCDLDAKQKEALKHVILASFRLRGISPSSLASFSSSSAHASTDPTSNSHSSTNNSGTTRNGNTNTGSTSTGSININGAELYKDLFQHTFQAARFALKLDQARLFPSATSTSTPSTSRSISKAASKPRLSMTDMQEKVDILLGLFVPETGALHGF